MIYILIQFCFIVQQTRLKICIQIYDNVTVSLLDNILKVSIKRQRKIT